MTAEPNRPKSRVFEGTWQWWGRCDVIKKTMRPAVANDWSATVTRRHVTITYTNVLLFYVISFSVLIDCLLICCVVFIVFYCVAYSLFFFSITFDGVCPSLIKLIVIVIVSFTCKLYRTQISGHPSAVGRAQNRESSPVKDRRSTTVPRNQPVQP